MKTINIKGKDYVPVHERIKHFRKSDDYKDWSIITEIVNMDAELAVVKAIILDNNGTKRATGHAYELQTDKTSFVNKTSYLENCETSAIGRALACLGIGIENSYASANEVQSAQKQQSDPELEKPWLKEKQKNQFIDKVRRQDYGQFDSAQEMYEELNKIYRMKRVYREEIEGEMNSDFNEALNK